MTARRDNLLSQLGITQYRLHRPAVLAGEVAIHLSAAVKLLIITEESRVLAHPVTQDLLGAVALTQDQVMQLSSQQLTLLPQPLDCWLWFVGVSPHKNYAKVQWVSPSLIELSSQAVAKRDLWQQICHYDDQDLFSLAK